MRRPHYITVTAVLSDVEVDVTCEVEGRYLPASRVEPAEYPEVYVDHVRESESGLLRDDLIPAAEMSREVERLAVEAATDEALDRYEDAIERMAEMRG